MGAPRDPLRESLRALETHAGEAVQPGALDLEADLRTGAAQPHRASPPAQAASQHGQIHHQRDVRKDELGEVHDEIALGSEGTSERLSPSALGGSILVSATPQHGRLFAEVDDRANLFELTVGPQGEKNPLQKMSEIAD